MSETTMRDIYILLDEYRDRCLWFLRVDYYPSTVQEAKHLLQTIARRGDRAAYQRAMDLMKRIP